MITSTEENKEIYLDKEKEIKIVLSRRRKKYGI